MSLKSETFFRVDNNECSLCLSKRVLFMQYGNAKRLKMWKRLSNEGFHVSIYFRVNESTSRVCTFECRVSDDAKDQMALASSKPKQLQAHIICQRWKTRGGRNYLPKYCSLIAKLCVISNFINYLSRHFLGKIIASNGAALSIFNIEIFSSNGLF